MALNFKNFKGLFSSHLLTVKLILLAGACSAGKESACKKKKKESACNAGDLGSIPGLGRSPGEGDSMDESLVGYSPWDRKESDPTEQLHWFLEKGKDTHSSILAWKIPWTVQSMESQRAGHD